MSFGLEPAAGLSPILSLPLAALGLTLATVLGLAGWPLGRLLVSRARVLIRTPLALTCLPLI